MEFEGPESSQPAQITQELIHKTEELTGRKIQLSKAQVAHGARASYRASLSTETTDFIEIDPADPHIDHLIGHELGHITHFETVPYEQRRLSVVTSAANQKMAVMLSVDPIAIKINSLRPDLYKSRVKTWTSGLVAQLAITPADIDIESKLHSIPQMREKQEASLASQIEKEKAIISVKNSVPKAVWLPSAAMAYTLHANQALLTGDKTLLMHYEGEREVVDLGENLLTVYKDIAPNTLDEFYEVSERWNVVLGLPPILDFKPLEVARSASLPIKLE